MFIKIELLSCIEKIQLEVKCENKSKKNLINLKDSISINLKPFNPFTKEDKIFFDMKLEEKQSLSEISIGYFKNNEISLKIRFLEVILNENIFRPYKFEDIFSLVEMFQYNFFDENFNYIFKNINKFVLVLKDEGTLKSTKSKLIDLYDNIMKVKDLNIIHEEI